ncbi:MAG: gamma-glutamylcyclotransferase [Desulfobulbus sp.]|nr:gamma-glutamylcyclotransferase [Desulfobulbus sp.]
MSTEPLPDLFTYGSLMCEDIMTDVAASRLRCTPATLSGYRRFLVKDEKYPGVIPMAGGVVPGIVYHGITPGSRQRLDRFEGEMYERKPVTVQYADGRQTVVDCYLFRPAFAHRLTATEWDFTIFLQGGKTVFQHQYCGFKAID